MLAAAEGAEKFRETLVTDQLARSDRTLLRGAESTRYPSAVGTPRPSVGSKGSLAIVGRVQRPGELATYFHEAGNERRGGRGSAGLEGLCCGGEWDRRGWQARITWKKLGPLKKDPAGLELGRGEARVRRAAERLTAVKGRGRKWLGGFPGERHRKGPEAESSGPRGRPLAANLRRSSPNGSAAT